MGPGSRAAGSRAAGSKAAGAKGAGSADVPVVDSERWFDPVSGEVLELGSVLDPETGAVLAPASIAGLCGRPGAVELGGLASLDLDSLSAGSLVEVLELLEAQAGWLDSVRLAAVAALDTASCPPAAGSAGGVPAGGVPGAGGPECGGAGSGGAGPGGAGSGGAADGVPAGGVPAGGVPAGGAGSDGVGSGGAGFGGAGPLGDGEDVPRFLAEQVQTACRVGRAEAQRRIRTARAICGGLLPATGAALAEGRIGLAHATNVVRAVVELPDPAAGWVERALLADPRAITPWQWRQAAERLAVQAFPALAAQRAGQGQDGRELRTWRTGEGRGTVVADLALPDWAVVDSALTGLAGPFNAADGRGIEVRRADALVGLCQSWLDSGRLPADGGIRPHLSVLVPLDTLTGGGLPGWARTAAPMPPAATGRPPAGTGRPAGTCWPAGAAAAGRRSAAPSGAHGGGSVGALGPTGIPTGIPGGWAPNDPEPAAAFGGHRAAHLAGPGRGPRGAPALLVGEALDPATLARLACDSVLSRLLYTPADGIVLDRGRDTRVIEGRLRAKLLARDGGTCRFPTCGAQHNLHQHHIRPWELGGPTNEANLLTVCLRHHKTIHEGGWRVRLTGAHCTWTSPAGHTSTTSPPLAHPPQRSDPPHPQPPVTRADTCPRPDPDTRLDLRAEPDADTGLDVGAGADPDTALEVGGEPDPDTALEVGGEPDPDTGLDLGGGANADTALDVGGEPDPDTALDVGGEPDPDTGLDLGGGANSDTGLDLGAEPDADTALDVGGEADPDTGLDVGGRADADTGLEVGAGPERISGSEPVAGPAGRAERERQAAQIGAAELAGTWSWAKPEPARPPRPKPPVKEPQFPLPADTDEPPF